MRGFDTTRFRNSVHVVVLGLASVTPDREQLHGALFAPLTNGAHRESIRHRSSLAEVVRLRTLATTTVTGNYTIPCYHSEGQMPSKRLTRVGPILPTRVYPASG
jgi:hypothetical protein